MQTLHPLLFIPYILRSEGGSNTQHPWEGKHPMHQFSTRSLWTNPFLSFLVLTPKWMKSSVSFRFTFLFLQKYRFWYFLWGLKIYLALSPGFDHTKTQFQTFLLFQGIIIEMVLGAMIQENNTGDVEGFSSNRYYFSAELFFTLSHLQDSSSAVSPETSYKLKVSKKG